jgi:D-alanine-D-alanine ligase
MQQKQRVAVLLGGMSSEREVSLKSGAAVARALRSRGYEVVEIDAGRDLPARLVEAAPDAVVSMLHGTFGEDGCVQGLLEVMGLPYSGSGVDASALAMDKVRTKRLLAAAGLPVAEDVVIDSATALAGVLELPFGMPVVVKPVAEGSSVGTAVVQRPADLAEALRRAGRWGQVLVERFVPGPEVTVSMLDGAAFPLVEIRPHEGFYDYRNKYTSGCTSYLCPAPIEPTAARRVQQMAEQAVGLIGVEGVARVDFMLGGGDAPVILEINTIPGMTELSLVPMAAREAGISFDELSERIVRGARLRRRPAERE